MAELKIKKKDKKQENVVLEITYEITVPLSNIEDCIKGAGDEHTNKFPNEFTGRTDQELVSWIRKIINQWHNGDPVEFVYDWELTLDSENLRSFDIKLEK